MGVEKQKNLKKRFYKKKVLHMQSLKLTLDIFWCITYSITGRDYVLAHMSLSIIDLLIIGTLLFMACTLRVARTLLE